MSKFILFLFYIVLDMGIKPFWSYPYIMVHVLHIMYIWINQIKGPYLHTDSCRIDVRIAPSRPLLTPTASNADQPVGM